MEILKVEIEAMKIKRTRSVRFLLPLIIIIGLFSCKKEKEVWDRIEGKWIINEYLVESVDMADSLRDHHGYCLREITFKVNRKKFGHWNSLLLEGDNCMIGGRYKLESKNIITIELTIPQDDLLNEPHIALNDFLNWHLQGLEQPSDAFKMFIVYRREKHEIRMKRS